MKKIIIALFVTMLLFSANTVVEAKGQKDFKKYWKEFQTAVAKGDKNKISKMTNFPLVEVTEVGSGGESYADRSISDFNQYTFKNYFLDKATVKAVSSTKHDKLKKRKLDKTYYYDEAGMHLADKMPVITLKIGGKKEWTILTFASISGKYALVIVEYHRPE